MQHCDKQQNDFTPQDVEIISKETVFKGFFKMVKYRFKHRLFAGGWSGIVEREMFERGHAAAMLPYDPVTDQVVIIEQIRVGALEHSHPWQLEIVAGMIDRDESSEEVIRREAEEEAGIQVGRVASVTSYYPSSGGCSEKLDVFIGEVDATKAHGIHGLDYENEDIRVRVISRETAYQWVKDGKFENGASIIALQWLQLNHQELISQWGQTSKVEK
ncbi:ADP-sugar pyrophosphatase [Vibrio owensii]|uniref:ADP-ribose diphosphatase n=1 Tax=Vibrio owensii TaxID=696485 RepID=UPI0028945504|nr:ADP-sugar pyrophosphatase [Vibrio owensii]